MKVLGIAKLTSKKGVHMAKVQCERVYSPEEVGRLELVAGMCVEDLWLYEPAMNKLNASCIGKDLQPVYSFQGGRPVIVDVNIK